MLGVLQSVYKGSDDDDDDDDDDVTFIPLCIK